MMRARDATPADSPRQSAPFFRRLDSLEIRFTRRVALACQRPRAQGLCAAVNWFGNGWLYLGVAIVLPLGEGGRSLRPLAAASLAAGFSFLAYVPLKVFFARVRPCDLDPKLRSSMRTMDRFSFPSGHCMTAVAVSLSLGRSYPALLPAACVAILLIAWARIALAHHYLTDLLAGAGLGYGGFLLVCMLFH